MKGAFGLFFSAAIPAFEREIARSLMVKGGEEREGESR